MGLSIFGILNMAGQSMSVEQQATAVTGHNLANVNNPNYSEQTLNMQTAGSFNTTFGQEGMGVMAVSITHKWDDLLNSQITAEGSTTGSLTAQQNALQEAETYLNEQLSSSSSSTSATSANGLSQYMSNFFDALQTLSTNPQSIPDRQAAVQAAQDLTQQFNNVSSGLTTLTQSLNTSVQNDVTSANSDLQQIASLNNQIIASQASGSTPNDLMDQREKLLEDLSSKVNITTTSQTNGSVDISIGGVTMVTNGTTPDSLATYTDSNGNLQIKAATAGTSLTLTGGSIEGNITARDGAVASLQSSVNALASQLITSAALSYNGGHDLNGNTGGTLFNGTNASDISVSAGLVANPSSFQASGSATASGDNSVVLALIQMSTTKYAGLGSMTLSQNYSQAVGSLGSSLQSVNGQLANSSSVSQMLTQQRSAETGVSTDSEMTNLMQFQKAYEASAELITTLNQMLETVVTMKTV